ncbi:YwmB family TATA-box binding protein [Bacillota bacterium LX-D]|nr:YwmB family TATA-box binding protein [Bacillota bacterium LX-D]
MLKKLFLVIGLIIVCGAYCFIALPNLDIVKAKRDPVICAFDASHANLKEASIQGWAQLKSTKVDQDELLPTLKDAATQLVPDAVLTCTTTSGPRVQGFTLEGSSGQDISFYGIIQSSKDLKGKVTTYLLLSLTEKGKDKNITNWKRKLEKIFADLHARPNISTYLTGTIEQKLTQHQKEALIAKMFAEAQAKKIEGISNQNLVSFSGYSRKIKENVKVKDYKLNLNAAVSYNEVERKTYVLLGSPLLNGEY